jgi:hypothetical protein
VASKIDHTFYGRGGRRNNKRGMTLEGDDALAKAFNSLPFKVQKKAMAPALRDVMRQQVLPKSRANVPQASGALSKSLAVKAAKTSKAMSKRGETRVGSVVVVDKKRLQKHMAASGASAARIKSATEKYFYPQGVEIGTKLLEARRPMTRALTSSKDKAMSYTRSKLTAFINGEAAKMKAAVAAEVAT